jgi:hypothetical protein
LIASPADAGDLSCAQWISFRTGDKSSPYINQEAPLFVAFIQGMIDGINASIDSFNGYLLKEGPDGKPVPAELTPQLTLANTVAVLDRKCTANSVQSAHVVAVQEVDTEMKRRLTPVVESMNYTLHELNEAKGYK